MSPEYLVADYQSRYCMENSVKSSGLLGQKKRFKDMHQRRPQRLSSTWLSSTFEGQTTSTMARQQYPWCRFNSSVCVFVQTKLYWCNSTALSINKTGGVKGTCKKANPYYRGLAYNDKLQKFRITFTANGRLQFAPRDQIQSLLSNSNRFHFRFIHMTYFQQFFFADIPYLKLELSTWIWRSLLAVHMIRGISRVFFMAFPW